MLGAEILVQGIALSTEEADPNMKHVPIGQHPYIVVDKEKKG